MSVRKKDLQPFKPKQVTVHKGKGASEQVLPSRHAVNTLTQGDPMARTLQNYAKATPTANPIAEAEPFGS